MDMGPSLAYKITDALSLGFGVNLVRGIENIENFVNLGVGDAFSSVKAYAWGWGYHAGLLFQYSKATRVGLSYISRVPQVLKGKSTLYGVPGLGTVISDNFQEPIRLPSLARISVYHDFNYHWAVMGSAAYSQWDHFKTLLLENVASVVPGTPFFAPATATASSPLYWRNTWEGSVGVHYTVNPKWLFRAGLGVMQTPTNDATREIRFPDNNKTTVAVGSRFKPTPDVNLDAGFARIIVKHSLLNIVDGGGNTTSGIEKTNANAFGLQLTWNMG